MKTQNRFLFYLLLLLLPTGFQAQNNYEVGLEITAANFSTFGGSFGGALKFAIVNDEDVAFGPTFRYHRFWSQNNFTGFSGSGSVAGGGFFVHYRLLEWFFLGTEIEMLQNPFRPMMPDRKWALTAFVGGGVSHEFQVSDNFRIRMNIGILYDVADALRDPYVHNPSPLRSSYFVKLTNPTNPNQGKYLPIIYRVAFFIPLTKN
jgi:hypothetical protein